MNRTTSDKWDDKARPTAPHGALRSLPSVIGAVLAFVAALIAGVLLAFVVVEAFGRDDPPAVDPIELGLLPSNDG